MLKKRSSRFLSILIVAAILITSLPIDVLAEKETSIHTNSEGVEVDLSATEESIDEAIDTVAKETVEKEEETKEEIKFDSGSVVESPATDYRYTIEDSKVTISRYIGSDTEVVIPAEIEGYPVTSIGEYAFAIHESITSITIPEGVTSIGEDAFSRCSSLTSIIIPGSVASIGEFAFSDCSSLTSITIPGSVTSIGRLVFYDCSSLTSITISEGVTRIEDKVFYGCSSLTSITIPGSVTDISISAFSGCSSLTSIEVSENNESYSSEEGVLFNKEKTVLICCLEGKKGSYVIPESVTSIGVFAFNDCSSLTSITIPEGVTSIGRNAFNGCSIISITIPEGVASIGEFAFSGCSSLTSIEVSENNLNYSSADGVLFNKDKTRLIRCPGEKKGSYVIPDSVTDIVWAAFYDCSSITNISIPEGVTSIGIGAFDNCTSLISITIPKGVTSIEHDTFDNCTSLTSITIPKGVTSIGEDAFKYCSSLTSITIPEGLTSIGNSAFYGCSSLKDVYYTGSEAQWKDIEILYIDNDDLLNATIHFNYVPGAIPDEITPSVDSNVVVDSDKATVSGITAESKPADVIAQFEGSDNIQVVGKDGKVLADDALVGTGCKIQLVENGEVKDEVTVVIKGEIDGNGKIDSDDAIYLLRNTLFASLYPVIAEDDVDGNGGYNSDDAIHLLRHTLFPAMYPLK